MKKYQTLINNKLIAPENGLLTISILTKKPLLMAPKLPPEIVKEAFIGSQKAFETWKDVPLGNKIKLFEKWILIMKKHKDEFIWLLMNEVLKNKKESIAEFDRTIEIIEHTIFEAKNMPGQLLDGRGWSIENKHGIFIREPLGVTVAIAPFNYPFNLAMTKIAPALITGNTVIFKPASYSAGMGCLIGQTFFEADFPSGILNVITGKGSEIGDLIITDPCIKLINFTGSTQVGKHILNLAPQAAKIFELGGKDAAIILDDADLKLTVKEIMSGAYSYNGQRCTAIKRVITSKKTAKKLVPLLKEEILKLKHGLPEEDAQITPIMDTNNIENLLNLIKEAKKDGAVIITGGKVEGNLFQATLLDNVSLKSKIAWEEPFAPILPIIYCSDVNEMIKINNTSEYGLQACIFTNDINLAYNIAKKLDVGSVNINSAPKRGPDHFPFTGVKNSGIGTQGIKNSLESYTRPKGIIFNFTKIA